MDEPKHDCLEEVLTGGEVTHRYHLASAGVMQAIKLGYIEGRHTGSVWLIRKADAEKRWGYRRKDEEQE